MVLHPSIGLIFRLNYRVKIVEVSGNMREQDFIIGWALFIPNLASKNTTVLQSVVELNFIMGPGYSLTGEIMYDQTEV